MSETNLMLLSLCLVLLLMVMVLIGLIVWSLLRSQQLPMQLLREQTVENQKLRNLLLAPDVATLAGLNSQTLPQSESLSASSSDVDVVSLGEAIDYEESLSAKGYHIGDLGPDLDAQGWASPIVRNTDDPIAYGS